MKMELEGAAFDSLALESRTGGLPRLLIPQSQGWGYETTEVELGRGYEAKRELSLTLLTSGILDSS